MENNIQNKFLGIKTISLIFSTLYLILIFCFEGLKIEHWVIVGLFNTCIWANKTTRKFILGFSAFIVFAIIYDLMKVYPNFNVNPVDIAHLYNFEKSHFGFTNNGMQLTPNEYFAIHHNWFFDLICGIFYINWMPIPLAFGVWLFLKNKYQLLIYYSIAFLFVNLIGFSLYYIHPAAPPWYVAKYGFELHINTCGETGGLERFDALLGINIFSSIYSRNSNIFAAFPSLHSAYPVVVLFYAFKAKVKHTRWYLGLFMVGIWFSAVYTSHHYITDVLMGIICAVVGILVFEKIIMKFTFLQKMVQRYAELN